MDLETFRSLPTDGVARLVREAGPKVCVFPGNGSRRWFMLQHPPRRMEDFASAYLDRVAQRQIEIYRLLFAHGLDTVLAPAFGPYQMKRGERYVRMAAEGLARLATLPAFLEFYKAYGVRVRFYGDHRKFFGPTPYAYLSDLFDQATAQTSSHDRHRVFFGVFANDPAETMAQLAIQYHVEHGRTPDRRALVEMYYGEYVGPVDLFIGFSKFRVFDTPLLMTGTADLYFSVSPSPYLTEQQLRDILYDHLYTRRGELDHRTMDADARACMKEFYSVNVGNTLGVGAKHGEVWYPLPQVELPTHVEGDLAR